MSAIKDGGYTVELKGKRYRLLFTLNALDEVQTRFGSYDKLGEAFDKRNKDWVKDTKWLLATLINEGLLEEDESATLLTEKQIGRMIHMGNLAEVQRAIVASLKAGAAGDGEGDEDMDGNREGETDEGEAIAAQES